MDFDQTFCESIGNAIAGMLFEQRSELHTAFLRQDALSVGINIKFTPGAEANSINPKIKLKCTTEKIEIEKSL